MNSIKIAQGKEKDIHKESYVCTECARKYATPQQQERKGMKVSETHRRSHTAGLDGMCGVLEKLWNQHEEEKEI